MTKISDSSRLQWYVLYTAPRAEKKVEERIKKLQVPPAETYLPLHLSLRRWSDRVKQVEAPLFPSYLFVRTTETLVRSLLAVRGIVRVLYFEGRPAVMRDHEIQSIRTFLKQAACKEISFQPDEEVLIACGPLKDISGRIKRIGKNRLVLHLEQLQITVSIATDQVVKKNFS
ncbi:transcription termination/antitermination protein NusG [Limibacterium fermenti]|uniref:transcription termination/antitermination protein NusG n=1 Tax=Limibacterium fermenti TaxID=3229863 RepID=UPI000E900D48|nr:antitermination protein NusG [Porphyromonadaceae bacterium]